MSYEPRNDPSLDAIHRKLDAHVAYMLNMAAEQDEVRRELAANIAEAEIAGEQDSERTRFLQALLEDLDAAAELRTSLTLEDDRPPAPPMNGLGIVAGDDPA